MITYYIKLNIKNYNYIFIDSTYYQVYRISLRSYEENLAFLSSCEGGHASQGFLSESIRAYMEDKNEN
jgi:hypothetical protein